MLDNISEETSVTSRQLSIFCPSDFIFTVLFSQMRNSTVAVALELTIALSIFWTVQMLSDTVQSLECFCSQNEEQRKATKVLIIIMTTGNQLTI